MRRIQLIICLLPCLLCFKNAAAQFVSIGVGVDPVWRTLHVRGEVQAHSHLRFGLEHARFQKYKIAESSLEEFFLASWYAGAVLTYVLPAGDHWGLYGRVGFGYHWTGFTSGNVPLWYEYSFNASVAGRTGLGLEYRWNRWRLFSDATVMYSIGGSVAVPLSLAAGIAMDVVREK